MDVSNNSRNIITETLRSTYENSHKNEENTAEPNYLNITSVFSVFIFNLQEREHKERTCVMYIVVDLYTIAESTKPG